MLLKRTDIRREILSKVREILIRTYHLPLGRRVNATVPFSDSFSHSKVLVSETARIEIRERLYPSFAEEGDAFPRCRAMDRC